MQLPGSQRNEAGAASAAHGVARETRVELYEAELKEARLWARIIGLSYTVSQFLTLCNLTWATVALLGAFLPNLLSLDFAFVTSLIFVEAGRLASAAFFMRLFKRPIVHSIEGPKYINHRAPWLRFLSRRAANVLQLILLAPSFVLPIIGHIFLNYDSTTRNLQMSLRIFYSMVAINSLVSLIHLICSALAFISLNKPPEQSVLRYFDTVLERAVNCGFLQANDFEFFPFAYMMLADAFRQSLQPEPVAKNHKRLIQYMYAHRLGVDFLDMYLDADDVFERLVAVNMVGFWADRTWGVGVPDLNLSEVILTKLADKAVVTGQVGWAAMTSFGVLASTPEGARIVASTRTSSNEGLPARLVYLIDDSSSRSLSVVRTLRGFYEQLCENEQSPPMAFGEAEMSLVEKLRRLAREARVHRLRVQAAYLLLLMGILLKKEVVLSINPSRDAYWFRSEWMMLDLLRGHTDDAPPGFLREDALITPPPWAKAHAPQV